MLDRLELRDVGPASHMRLELAPRLNIIAGDNGLGKTFLLDVAWWALTGSWIGYPAFPSRSEDAQPTISSAATAMTPPQFTSVFNAATQAWPQPVWATLPNMRPKGLFFYARVDGGASLWDGLRTAGRDPKPFDQGRLSSAFHFAPQQIWDGLTANDQASTILCNGLIRDWSIWQLQRGEAIDKLKRVLEVLSSHPGEAIRLGASTTRISVEDVRDIPTLEMPYGTIPVVHASAGMRRILSLAYLLVWMWREHVEAAKLKKTAPSKSLVMLFDEVESHLHPQWQRVILPALLRVVRELSPEIDVQIIATTHAPLVLASLEPHFDEAKDALFHLDLEDREVKIAKIPWRMRGDASAWLKSEVMGLGEARSVEAEQAIQKAMEAMKAPDLPIEDVRRIHHELHAVLKDVDPFWPRWLLRARQAGVEP